MKVRRYKIPLSDVPMEDLSLLIHLSANYRASQGSLKSPINDDVDAWGKEQYTASSCSRVSSKSSVQPARLGR